MSSGSGVLFGRGLCGNVIGSKIGNFYYWISLEGNFSMPGNNVWICDLEFIYKFGSFRVLFWIKY